MSLIPSAVIIMFMALFIFIFKETKKENRIDGLLPFAENGNKLRGTRALCATPVHNYILIPKSVQSIENRHFKKQSVCWQTTYDSGYITLKINRFKLPLQFRANSPTAEILENRCKTLNSSKYSTCCLHLYSSSAACVSSNICKFYYSKCDSSFPNTIECRLHSRIVFVHQKSS